MKSMLRILMAAALLSTPAAFAQGRQQQQQRQGSGSTTAPHAYCDQDGDGLCDYCGQPVGDCTGRQDGKRRGGGTGTCPNPNCPNPSCPRNGSGAAARQSR